MVATNNLLIIGVIGAAALLMSGKRKKPASAQIAGISGGGGGLFDTVTKKITAPKIATLPEILKISPEIVTHPSIPGGVAAGVVVTDTIGMLDDAEADPGYTLGGGGDVVIEDIATPTTKPKPNVVYLPSPTPRADTNIQHIPSKAKYGGISRTNWEKEDTFYSPPAKKSPAKKWQKDISDAEFQFD